MLYLHGIGHFHPATVITNQFLVDMDIGITPEWLDRAGIRERRTVLPLDYIRTTLNTDPRAANEASTETNSATALSAARLALARAGIEPADLGMVISGGCSPQYSVPAEAAIVAAELGAEAMALDINCGCCTFVAQLHYLSCLRPEFLPDFVLLVNAENSTRVIDYRDRTCAPLIGDASVAAVVSPRVPARAVIYHTTLHSAVRDWRHTVVPSGCHLRQAGMAMRKFALEKAPSVLHALRCRPEAHGCEFRFIGHQVVLPLLREICSRTGIHEAMHLYNFERFGSCASAGAPSVLSQEWGTLSNTCIGMVVFGAGLSWGGALLSIKGA
jgi:3-oxoacyl-[acyl-carrier-protein] synthase-3